LSGAAIEAKGNPWSGGTLPYALHSKKFGMWLFLVSDAISFGAILVAYAYVRMAEGNWPLHFSTSSVGLASVMTFLLMTSSLTMMVALSKARAKDRVQASNWIFITMALGLGFIAIHGYEWMHLIEHGITPSSFAFEEGEELIKGPPMFGGTFFLITGMHMLHITGGVVYLFGMGLAYRFGKFRLVDLEVMGLYWHFVDLVWMFVFPMVYLTSVDTKL